MGHMQVCRGRLPYPMVYILLNSVAYRGRNLNWKKMDFPFFKEVPIYQNLNHVEPRQNLIQSCVYRSTAHIIYFHNLCHSSYSSYNETHNSQKKNSMYFSSYYLKQYLQFHVCHSEIYFKYRIVEISLLFKIICRMSLFDYIY